MDISRISGSGGSVIWDALMAMSKKTAKPAQKAVSNDISNVTTSPVSAVNKSDTSKKTEFINTLESIQANDSGLALLKSLNNSVSNLSLINIIQSDNAAASATDGSVIDSVLQSIGNSDGSGNPSGGGSKDLLSALMSSSNAYMSTNALSPDKADPLADTASVEKTLNSFMRVPDVSKYVSGKLSMDTILSKFDITV